VAPPVEAHGLTTGGPVEGLGHRGPPVDDQRVVVLVGHGDATDVVSLPADGLRAVDATEDQRGVPDRQLRETAHDAVVDDLPLETGLVRAPPPDLDHAGQARRGTAARLEGLVGLVEVCLLGFQVGIAAHREPAILPAPPGRSICHDPSVKTRPQSPGSRS